MWFTYDKKTFNFNFIAGGENKNWFLVLFKNSSKKKILKISNNPMTYPIREM